MDELMNDFMRSGLAWFICYFINLFIVMIVVSVLVRLEHIEKKDVGFGIIIGIFASIMGQAAIILICMALIVFIVYLVAKFITNKFIDILEIDWKNKAKDWIKDDAKSVPEEK